MLDDILSRLDGIPATERAALKQEVVARSGSWVPNPGPQTDAYFCPADVLLYGGQGGGGKSALLAGLATTEHSRSLLLRVQYTDLGGLIEEAVKIRHTARA